MARIAFFGTPQFAATVFDGLIEFCKTYGHTLAMVVCQPDRAQGRHLKVLAPAVKVSAQKHEIPVFQPQTLKKGTEEGDAFAKDLEKANLDIAIVVAYGRILPKRLLDMPRLGFINVHASLLPRWRGAAPIQRAIQEGDATTGIAIMHLVPELDAGDVYCSTCLNISEQDTSISLTEKLAHLGTTCLVGALPKILDGSLTAVPQSSEGVTYAHQLTKSDGALDFTMKAQSIVNQVRAMTGWPESFCQLGDKRIKLFNPTGRPGTLHQGVVGEVIALDDHVWIKCIDGLVGFSEIQIEGKKRLQIEQAKAGHLLCVGDVLTRTSP